MAQKLTQDRRTIVTTGVAIQLSVAPLKSSSVLLIADPDNTGTIYVGDVNVSAASRLGIPIVANDSTTLDPTEFLGTSEEMELSKIWADSTVNGDVIIVVRYVNEGD